RERLVVELLCVFATSLTDAVRLLLRVHAELTGRRLRGLRQALADGLCFSLNLREATLDFRLELLAFGLRLLCHREALTDLLCACREHRHDRTPEKPPHEIEKQEKVHDRDQHPERVHGRNEDLFLQPGTEKHYGRVRKMSRIPTTSESTPRPSASAAPSTRLFRMSGAASGLRPIASEDFAVAIPSPIPTPRTARP